MTSHPHRLLTAALLLLTASLVVGCGKKIEAVCEEKCGSDAATCISKGEASEATAEERGCESEFESYVSCADEKGTCTNGTLDATAPCAAELEELGTCMR